MKMISCKPRWLFTNLSVMLLILGLSTPVKSQLTNKTLSVPERIIFQENFEPPGDGQPTETSSAGSRRSDQCSFEELPIQTLMPKRNYGLTLQAQPSIFVYLPKTSAQQVVLTIRDQGGEYYQKAFLPINKNSNIVSFKLPESTIPLTIGKNYQWSLVFICRETVQPDDPILTGWVQRVELTAQLGNQLHQQTIIEKIQWYANHGYWYDLLTTIVETKESSHIASTPSSLTPVVNLTTIWDNLLDSIGIYDGNVAEK